MIDLIDFNKIKLPTKEWPSIKTIDMHTGGEPLRVIIDGIPEIRAHNVLGYRRMFRERYDHIRKVLMLEPRGHADMYGCILLPSSDKNADFGVIFMHNEGYSTMCGHATIAIAKLAVDAGWVLKKEPITTINIEAPCGILQAFVEIEKGEVHKIRFLNVPSFVVDLDQEVDVKGLGKVTYDLAYGGAYYAFVQAESVGLKCEPNYYNRLIETGKAIKHAVIAGREINHPTEADLSFLYGTIFIGEPQSADADSRNVCVFADGEVDRSPTGSGVSARAAIHHARGELGLGESMKIESILGSTFDVKIHEEVNFEGIDAVIPEVSGTAYITGKSEFLIDPKDPFKNGFILR